MRIRDPSKIRTSARTKGKIARTHAKCVADFETERLDRENNAKCHEDQATDGIRIV